LKELNNNTYENKNKRSFSVYIKNGFKIRTKKNANELKDIIIAFVQYLISSLQPNTKKEFFSNIKKLNNRNNNGNENNNISLIIELENNKYKK